MLVEQGRFRSFTVVGDDALPDVFWTRALLASRAEMALEFRAVEDQDDLARRRAQGGALSFAMRISGMGHGHVRGWIGRHWVIVRLEHGEVTFELHPQLPWVADLDGHPAL